jgi:acyl carrier protein
MRNQIPDHDQLLSQLKQLIADKFRFGEIEADNIAQDEPLIGGSLGLDSLDALELGMYVEEEFGITISSAAESRTALASIASLADFIRRQAPQRPAAGLTPRALPFPVLF